MATPKRKPESRAGRIARKRARVRSLILAYKSQPCRDCGEQYPPYVMDFDHVRGEKKFNVSQCTKRSMAQMLDEIGKCDVVCSNCHRERTHMRAGGELVGPVA